jgi:hypothetical protein
MSDHGRSRWRSIAAGTDVCRCGQVLAACPDSGWNAPTQVISIAPLLTRGQEARTRPGVERECHDVD